jgi:DNA phosphorothioation-associated putative methyltransferase
MQKNSFQTTAIARKTISVPYRNLLDKGAIYQSDKILDYGCGHGTDLKAINRFGYDISGYDKYNPDFNTSVNINEYNVIISNYVFNVISDPIEHQELVALLRGSKAQKIYIAVRADHTAVKENWTYNAYMGGYFTSTGSFQRFYNKDKIFQWFGNHTILKANKSMIQFILE